MKNTVRIMLIIACFSVKQQLHAQPVMTFFMRPYVESPADQLYDKLSTKLAKPGHIARKNSQLSNFGLVKGIFSTYAGYLALSNSFGQTTFPLKHALPIVYIVITERMVPIMMAGNTIHHWQIADHVSAKMYKVERHHIDPEDLYYWQVEEVPVPSNKIIPLESVTILAKPKNIVVPEGLTVTDSTANLLLPDLFVRKTSNNELNALYLLNLKHFFGHLHPLYKRDVTRYFTHVYD